MKHLLRIRDLTTEQIVALLDRAEELRRGAAPVLHPRSILGLFFFEPSTRTRFGFHAAIARLGGTGITLETTKHQPSMSEPESLEDTLRSIGSYCDAIVLRHPEEDAVDRAAALLDVRVINAGNGTDEHPTQALIDLFAIRSWHGRLDGLRVGIVGDLRRSRAAHSLVAALQHFGPEEIRLMHPEGAELPEQVAELERGAASEFGERAVVDVAEDLCFDALDVLYFAGLPRGVGRRRLTSEARHRFALTEGAAHRLSPATLILNPLPRIDEIDSAVDRLSNAGYFGQSGAGVFVRIAIVERLWTGAVR